MPKSEHRHVSRDAGGGGETERPIDPAMYANQFEIGYNAFEFLLDFGQDFEAVGETRVFHTRIATTPAYAKAFRALLDRSIDQYEALFGPIADVPAVEEVVFDEDEGAGASTSGHKTRS